MREPEEGDERVGADSGVGLGGVLVSVSGGLLMENLMEVRTKRFNREKR